MTSLKTKFVILIGDGMSDLPVEQLKGKTPLDVAKKPRMDDMCRRGIIGRTNNIPEGFSPGSDPAIMSIMGYDPRKYLSGRGPLEAASMGVRVNPGEYCYRCNVIHVDGARLADYSAGHIGSDEAREIMETLDKELGGDGVRFHAGVQYRHLLVLEGDYTGVKCFPPHDHLDAPWRDWLPTGDGAAKVIELIEASQKVLAGHPVNKKRIAAGKAPANSIWPWSGGPASAMRSFKEEYGVTASVVSAVDLVQGLGGLTGMEILKVEGATGLIDTNYEGKVEASMESLNRHDLAILHVEAPDECGHMGDVDLKVESVERFDARVVGPVLDHLEANYEHYRVIVLPDHTTALSTRTHAAGHVPFAFLDNKNPGDCGVDYNEKNSQKPVKEFDAGATMMAWLLGSDVN